MSEPRAASALEAAPVPTLVVRGGRLVYLNQAAARLLDAPREALVGQPWERVAPPEALERAERQARAGGGAAGDESWVRSGAARRPVQLLAASDGEDLVVQLLDLSGEASRRARLAELARFGTSLPSAPSREEVYAAVKGALGALGLEGAVLRPDGADLRVEAVLLDPERERALERSQGRALVGSRRAWSALDRLVWDEGAAFDDAWREAERLGGAGAPRAALPPGARELAAVGLRIDVGGAPAALLYAFAADLRAVDLPAFRLFAARVSAALDEAASVEALSTREAELGALDRVAEAVGASADLDVFLGRASEEIRGLLGADLVASFLLDRPHGRASLLHLHGAGDHARRELALVPLDGAVGATGLEGTTCVAAVANQPEPLRSVLVRLGLATVATVPLRFRSQLLGLIAVGFVRPRAPAACRSDLLQAVGVHVAAALETQRLFGDLRTRVSELSRAADENAALLHETRRRAEELGLLLEVGRSLVASLDLDQVLEAGVRNLARIVEAPEAFLLLDDGSGLRLVVRAATEGGQGLVGQAVAVADPPSVAGWVYQHRAPLVVEDAMADARTNPRLRQAVGARAYLALPLVTRGGAFGAVVICETRRARAFTPGEVERATAIANQLGVAIDNARLYADLRQSYADLARAQDQLVRQERLAALGELAAVIAHEVRNPLGVIFNSLGALRRLVKPAGDARFLFDVVGEEADRLNRIVGDLLQFARPAPAAFHPEPLGRVVDEAVAAALADGGRVRVERLVPDDLPLVPMDARLVRQTVLNVAANAAQAMPDGGTLTVRAWLEPDCVALAISDTGPGIPPRIRDRIFEPFFTTRATGTGLGLAIVKRTADDHQGRVDVGDAPGGGAIVTLRLPLAHPDAPGPRARREPRAEEGS